MLERANKSEYGLAAGVFSKDVNMINSISRFGPFTSSLHIQTTANARICKTACPDAVIVAFMLLLCLHLP